MGSTGRDGSISVGRAGPQRCTARRWARERVLNISYSPRAIAPWQNNHTSRLEELGVSELEAHTARAVHAPCISVLRQPREVSVTAVSVPIATGRGRAGKLSPPHRLRVQVHWKPRSPPAGGPPARGHHGRHPEATGASLERARTRDSVAKPSGSAEQLASARFGRALRRAPTRGSPWWAARPPLSPRPPVCLTSSAVSEGSGQQAT